MQDTDSRVIPALPLTDCTTLPMRPGKGYLWTGPLQPSPPPPRPSFRPGSRPAPFCSLAGWLGPTVTTSPRSHSPYLWCPQAPDSGRQTHPQARRGLRKQGWRPLPQGRDHPPTSAKLMDSHSILAQICRSTSDTCLQFPPPTP